MQRTAGQGRTSSWTVSSFSLSDGKRAFYQHCVNVHNGVRSHNLQEPAEDASQTSGKHNGSGAGNIGIAALLSKMERRIVTAHGPNDGNEAGQNTDTSRIFHAYVNIRPDLVRGVVLGESLAGPTGNTCDEANDNNESDEVEGRSKRV